MKTLKKNPSLLYLILLIAAAVAECLLFLPIDRLSQKGLAVGVLIYYITRLLTVAAPFLMLGTVTLRLTVERFTDALRPFWLYAVISLIKQLPLAVLHYAVDDAADLLSDLLSGGLTLLIELTLYFVLLLLCYLIFIRQKEIYAEDSFFSLLSTDCRALLLSAAAMLVYTLVTEIISIVNDASARLWLVDLIDILNYIFILLYDILLFIFAFLVGRWMQLRYVRSFTESETAE